MRNGVDPAGHPIKPKYMPWLGYRNMTDDELRSIWLYLQALPRGPARPLGSAASLSK